MARHYVLQFENRHPLGPDLWGRDATTRFQRASMPTYKCPEQLLDHLAGGGEHRL
jgi:hypothetical protein